LFFFSCSLPSSSFFSSFSFSPSSTIANICHTSLAIVSHVLHPLLPTSTCFTHLANSKSPTHPPTINLGTPWPLFFFFNLTFF
jgi:hypothetical protein